VVEDYWSGMPSRIGSARGDKMPEGRNRAAVMEIAPAPRLARSADDAVPSTVTVMACRSCSEDVMTRFQACKGMETRGIHNHNGSGIDRGGHLMSE
jgi:hypothetical protein